MNSNPARLLEFIDERLNASLEITIFGRSALSMRFPDNPLYGRTVDVDVILHHGQAEALLDQTNFWDVVDQLNNHFCSENLYMTHFFDEQQLVLRPDWQRHRTPVKPTYQNLRVFLPADEDLFLTKLMRYDPIDLEDARAIATAADWGKDRVKKIIESARVPDIPELKEQFRLCTKAFLSAA